MALTHSSVIVTGAAVDTRARERLSFAFLARPQAMSIYVRFVESGSILMGGFPRILEIGAGGFAPPCFTINMSGALYVVNHHPTTAATVSSALAIAPSFGNRTELLVTLAGTGAVQISQSINEGATTAGATSGAALLATAWSSATLWINAQDATANVGLNAYRNIEFQSGIHTMQEMRVRAGTD